MNQKYARIRLFDALRGLALLSMTVFHLCYDLNYLFGVPLAIFHSPFIYVWQNITAWTFLIIAGFMSFVSQNNFKRAGKYCIVALLIYLITSFFAIDTPITFGIIFCMAASTFITAILFKLKLFGKYDLLIGCVLLALFFICFNIPSGYISFFGMRLSLSEHLYTSSSFAWLGFPNASFSSGDYYPLIPFSFLFISAAYLGSSIMRKRSLPKAFFSTKLPILEKIGQKSLLIYLVHQPLILLLLHFCTSLFPFH